MVDAWLPVETIFERWRPGSYSHGWGDEEIDLIARDEAALQVLEASIDCYGFLPSYPIMLGDDGRVWDGHHRLVALRRMLRAGWILPGFLVPVEFGYHF